MWQFTRSRTVTHMQIHDMPVFQIGEAMLMQTLDRYIRQHLFGQEFDPFSGNDWKILLAQNGVVTQHIIKVMSQELFNLQQQVQSFACCFSCNNHYKVICAKFAHATTNNVQKMHMF